jgi:hypothetical protein
MPTQAPAGRRRSTVKGAWLRRATAPPPSEDCLNSRGRWSSGGGCGCSGTCPIADAACGRRIERHDAPSKERLRSWPAAFRQVDARLRRPAGRDDGGRSITAGVLSRRKTRRRACAAPETRGVHRHGVREIAGLEERRGWRCRKDVPGLPRSTRSRTLRLAQSDAIGRERTAEQVDKRDDHSISLMSAIPVAIDRGAQGFLADRAGAPGPSFGLRLAANGRRFPARPKQIMDADWITGDRPWHEIAETR